MAFGLREQDGSRGGAVLAVLGVHALLGAGLIWGLGAPLARVTEQSLKLFQVIEPPPPPPPPVVPVRHAPSETEARRFAPANEGAASPANLRGRASPIVAPPPIVPIFIPPPVIAAPLPDLGTARSTGAAQEPGPGTGAGGIGQGRGSGAGGGGDGGGGYGADTPPRLLRGRLRDSDYPRAAGEEGAGGIVSVRFTIALDGRAVNCRVTRSSGNGELDATTCRLIEQRYRFRPALDEAGEPVVSDMVENHEWVVRNEQPAGYRFAPPRAGRPPLEP